MLRSALSKAMRVAVAAIAWLLTAVRGNWDGVAPDQTTRIYFANHCSNGDFVLIWTVLPPRLRRTTRPVAASDYWLNNTLRRFIIRDVFNGLLIERDPASRVGCPVDQMADALESGQSLILFPEGTRNPSDDRLLPFKSGLFHLANARPDVELVPVWIDNLSRVMPKGEYVPVPIGCTVTFGAALDRVPGEARDVFLTRAADALKATNPGKGDGHDL